MRLIVIINGCDVEITTAKRARLSVLRNKALIETNNTGRPFEDWQMHSERGANLNPNQNIEKQGIIDGDRIFLNLAVGIGGNL